MQNQVVREETIFNYLCHREDTVEKTTTYFDKQRKR